MKRLLPLLFLAACSTSSTQPLPVPATPVSAAPPEISTFVVPIHVSLAPLLPLVEAQVPKTFTKLDGYELDPEQRFGLKYSVTRDPIALKMQGAGLHAATTVHYALEGCKRTRNPVSGAYTMWPCISCGFNEPMRTALLELQSRLEWGADWTLHSRTTARPAEFPNRCSVTLLNLDVTGWKLAPLVNEQLRDVAKSLDRNTPNLLAMRTAAGQVWSSLSAPYAIAPRTWLVLEPLDVALAPIRGNGLDVTTALTLHARTRIVIGERPATVAKPLPSLTSAEGNAAAVRVPIDLDLPYAEASRLLTTQFGGQKFRSGSSALTIESMRLTPGQGGRIDVEAAIDFDGGALKRYHGLVYLSGVPQFDPATSSVTIPDLRYAVDPKRKNPFLRMFDRFAHDEVERQLRAGAKWSLAPQLAAIRAEVERGLTRQLTPGVSLRGKVAAIEPVSLIAGGTTITMRVVATGSAEIDVKEWR